jgi:hypothetical protein
MRYWPPSAVTTPVPQETEAPLAPTLLIHPFKRGDVKMLSVEHVSKIMNKSLSSRF